MKSLPLCGKHSHDQLQISREDFNNIILKILEKASRRFGQRNVKVCFSDRIEVCEVCYVSSSLGNKTMSHQVTASKGIISFIYKLISV